MPAFSLSPRESSFENAPARFPKMLSAVEDLPPCDTEKPSADDSKTINVKKKPFISDRGRNMATGDVQKGLNVV